MKLLLTQLVTRLCSLFNFLLFRFSAPHRFRCSIQRYGERTFPCERLVSFPSVSIDGLIFPPTFSGVLCSLFLPHPPPLSLSLGDRINAMSTLCRAFDISTFTSQQIWEIGAERQCEHTRQRHVHRMHWLGSANANAGVNALAVQHRVARKQRRLYGTQDQRQRDYIYQDINWSSKDRSQR